MLSSELNKILDARLLNESWLKDVCRAISRDRAFRGKNWFFSLATLGSVAVKKVNLTYRGKNKPTNVLSFEAKSGVGFLADDRRHQFLGEILICWPVLKREAKLNKQTEPEYFKVLLVHGLVHLIGYDHEKSEAQARRMESVENRLLKLLARI